MVTSSVEQKQRTIATVEQKTCKNQQAVPSGDRLFMREDMPNANNHEQEAAVKMR